MSTTKSASKIRQVVAAAFVSIASTAALASPAVSTVQLPGVNEMSAGLYGDFQVYSLDLLAQCSPTDARCQPYSTNGPGGTTVSSGPGQISEGLLIYQGGASGDNYDSASGPLDSTATAGDNPFVPPQGKTDTFQFSAASEPTPPLDAGGTNNDLADFTGDQVGTWEVTLAALADYLGIGTATPNNLIFLFDNNQTGTTEGQWLYIWATAAILDSSGALVGNQCYSLFANDYTGGCQTYNADGSVNNAPDPVAPTFDVDKNGKVLGINNPLDTNYVAVVGDFCVDKSTGVSYNIGQAANEGACAIDVDTNLARSGYYVSNNLGQSSAEFAAWNAALEAYVIANYLSCPTCVLSIDAKFANMNDGPEQLWIGGTSFRNPPVLPEPGSLALLSLGLAAMWVPFRRRRQS